MDDFGLHEQTCEELMEGSASSFSSVTEIERRLAFFQSQINNHAQSESPRVLVLGTGEGKISVRLAQAGARVLETTSAELPKVHGTFHAVVDDHAFHGIIGRDRMKFLDEVKKQLSPRGVFVIRTQCGNPPPSESEAFWKAWNPATRCQGGNGVAKRYFGKPEDIRAELMIAGFVIVSADCILQPNGWQILEIVARPKL